MKNLIEKMRLELGAHATKLDALRSEETFPRGCSIDKLLLEINNYFKGAVVFGSGAKIVSGSLSYYLDIVYGLQSDNNDIYYRNWMYAGRLPMHMYTFAESPQGDQFCVDCETGNIYYWKHDAVQEDLALIASSVSDFISQLVADEGDDTDAKDKSSRVISVNLDF